MGKEQLGELFKKAIKNHTKSMAVMNISKGIAKDIDEAKGTFTLEREDSEDYPGVSMNAYFEDKGYFLLIPKENSTVVVGFADGETDAFIIQASEVSKMKLKIANATLTVSADGFRLERDGEDLKSCVNDYMTEVDKILVVQGNNIDKAATASIKTRINKILC